MEQNLQISKSFDLYSGLTESNLPLILSLIFACLTSIIIPIFLFSIIWYEKFGTDNRRTLLNKLHVCGCWCSLEYIMLAQPIDIIRYLYGPLPKHLCLLARIIKSAIFFQTFLYFDLIVVTRYAYIFWLKNPVGFDDNFLFLFLNLWVMMISYLSKFAQHMTMSRQTMSYYFCCGTDPRLETEYRTKITRYNYKNVDINNPLYTNPDQIRTRPRAKQQGRIKCRCHVTVPAVPTQEAIPEEGRQ